MRRIQEGSARRLINTARFHAYQPVFYDILDPDAIGASHCVELFEDFSWCQRFTVKGHGNPFFKADADHRGLIRCFQGRNADLQKAFPLVWSFVGGILQVETLMAQMPDILIL